jgi:lysophospholipase L1-like esterase
VSELLTLRDGIPRFAAKARAGEPATIVAFGTSMTLFGQYLARLPAALEAETHNASIRLVNRGLRGFVSFAAAFRVADDVLPHVPDLVLVEFAHNDGTAMAVEFIARALDAIVEQVRRVNPDCEFAFVYLAQAGAAAAGPTPAMTAYERVAGYYGFPSFDLATLTERLVAAGTATWTGEGTPALTFDGVHHTALAEELLGEPFAAAFIELLRASTAAPGAPRPARDRSLTGARRAAASRFLVSGRWAVGVPHNHDRRNAQAYEDDVAEATAPEATLVFPFEGSSVFGWIMGSGKVRVLIEGWDEVGMLNGGASPDWQLVNFSPVLPDGNYVLRLTVLEPPVLFGDLYVVGRPP